MSTKKDLLPILEKRVGPLTFGKFIIAARTMKDMTQVQMAKFLNISKSTLCDIEKDRQFVSVDLAAKMAKKCGMSQIVAVELVLQQMVNRSGLKAQVELKKVS